MRKKILIGVIAFFVTTSVAVATIYITQVTSTSPTDPVDSIDEVSDAAAAYAIANRLSSENGRSYEDGDIVINTKRTVEENWLVVNATDNTTSEDSQARIMVYILKVIDRKPIVVAYTSDSFSQNSFLEDTPQSVIDEANKYE